MEERKYIQVSGEYKKLEARADKYGGLEKALWESGRGWVSPQKREEIFEYLKIDSADDFLKWKTLDDFWSKPLKKAVDHLVGRGKRKEIQAITKLAMDGNYSSSMVRRSFRSKNVRYHVFELLQLISRCIYFTAYEMDVCEILKYSYWDSCAIDFHLALKLSKNDKKAIGCVKEAILGENTEILLSTSIIRAVFISGHEELVDLMCKLLVAARMQEGLRQQILEQADSGSVQTFLKIWKTCLDEDLFRYSSFVRAFGTWTGFSYESMKPSVIKKYTQFAYECLTDEGKRLSYAESDNNLEAYYALWAIGCYETEDCDAKVMELLTDERKYRRVLGWYFISNYDNSSLQMNVAKRFLDERDDELMAWIIQNLATTWNVLGYPWKRNETIQPQRNFDLPSGREERRKMFDQLKEMVFAIGNRKPTFEGNPFKFTTITLENTRAIDCMMSLAFYDFDQNHDICIALYDIVPYMNSDQKKAYYNKFCKAETISEDRKIVLEGLSDRTVSVKECVIEILSCCNLEISEIEALGNALKSKSSSLRKSIVDILKKQDREVLRPILVSLMHEKNEAQVQAALEIIISDKEEDASSVEKYSEELAYLKERSLSTQTEILLEQIMTEKGQEEAVYSEENGYGIYDVAYIDSLMQKNSDREILTEKQIKEFVLPNEKEIASVTARMNDVFTNHADYEYEILNWQGTREKILFGSMQFQTMPMPADADIPNYRWNHASYLYLDKACMDLIPFHEEFEEAMEEYAKDVGKYLSWYMVSATCQDYYTIGKHAKYQSWFAPYVKKIENQIYSFYQAYGDRYWQIQSMIMLMKSKMNQRKLYETAFLVYRSLIEFYGEENLSRNCVERVEEATIYYYGNVDKIVMDMRPLVILRELINSLDLDEEAFKEWFLYEHRVESLAKTACRQGIGIEAYFKACDEGVIQKDAICERIIGRGYATDLRVLTHPNRYSSIKKRLDKYSWANKLVSDITSRVADVEEKRGESKTPVTELATCIGRLEGASHFAKLLAALGKENFFRGYEYSSNDTKQAVLSKLLKRCYPAKEDTVEKLAEYLKQTDISDKRLAEAVMYAPQWAGFAEKILGWKGLKMAVWFFHAHINENFSAEKETEVALYSPISPQQFNNGAFDKDWFYRAYELMGEKKFQILYKSAKYITSGSNQHRRSQLYTDAALGRLDAEELKQEIIEKRNQEKLRCYPLIPLGEHATEEALARYEFIQKFLKESRQFGSQRKESEKKACNTALENLSITMGFMDVNRMTWFLESEKMAEIRPLMERQQLNGADVWLEISDDGTAELVVEKNGKRLKSVPKTLNKNETVLLLKSTIKELKEQKSRAKKSLEQAMVDCTEFGVEELLKIGNNPVLSPMLLSLVWMTVEENAKLGFLNIDNGKLSLQDIGGQACVLSDEEKLRLAHPHDFMQAKVWSEYMHKLYEEKLVQPFKQVFREYYPITEDELQEKNVSRRYAGHQVQPQKTIALLKGCGWTVDYEEGLQKVCYKENIIVRMYALADWFSPADIEAPTLEVIHFYDRETGELLDFEKVPPILFSEAMRDMDLVVSVAHVGGVDPEASHSTVEMRTAIAKELITLMKLSNVSFIGSHAKIEGTMANYSVHMGSGIVHGEGIGMIAILPVHSQARGRIFLPFADDDPKTAEIMSKIILLADDKKIKDPAILRQIR